MVEASLVYLSNILLYSSLVKSPSRYLSSMLLMRFWTVESSFCSAATSFYFLLCVHFANPLEFRYTSPIPFYWALIGLCIERTLHYVSDLTLICFDCYNKSSRCICRHCPNLSHQLRHNHIRGRLKLPQIQIGIYGFG